MSPSFTHVIITAPNAQIASVYQAQLEAVRSHLTCIQHCEILCVADPAGVRIGSGGGTLNALSYLDQKIGREKLSFAKVVIIHSGGDSRRAPFHTVCGKAWASMNTAQNGKLLSSPLTLLIEELTTFCTGVLNQHNGSIVIASSDVMLDIADMTTTSGQQQYPTIPQDAVSVVAVPEVPEVATNHGVLIGVTKTQSQLQLELMSGRAASYSTSAAASYLQKPSLEKMTESGAFFSTLRGASMGELAEDVTHSAAAVERGGSSSCNSTSHPERKKLVYIDTGVVIITGKACTSFLSLLDNPQVNQCTAKGLAKFLKGNDNRTSTSSSSDSLAAAATAALRLELYSDMLHATRTMGAPCDLGTYFARLGLEPSLASDVAKQTPYTLALQSLWRTLRETPLHLITVPDGKFCHLGTSSELLDMLCCATDAAAKTATKTATSAADASTTTACTTSSSRSANDNNSRGGDTEKHSKLLQKFTAFSKKYQFAESICCSVVKSGQREVEILGSLGDDDKVSAMFHGVTINSIFCMDDNDKSPHSSVSSSFASGGGITTTGARPSATSTTTTDPINTTPTSTSSTSYGAPMNFSVAEESLIEHSLLSGPFRIGRRTIVSNITGAMGRGLVILDGIMVQQVPLRPHVNALFDHTSPATTTATAAAGATAAASLQQPSGEQQIKAAPFVVLMFSLEDNIKAHYKDTAATICGAPFRRLLEIASVSANDLWPANVPDKDRTLWNAKLFSIGDYSSLLSSPSTSTDATSAVASALESFQLPFLWLQYLNATSCSGKGETTATADSRMPSEEAFIQARALWRSSVRLSLSDLLQYGDAMAIHSWRHFLQMSQSVPVGEGEQSLLSVVTVGRSRSGSFSLSPPVATVIARRLDAVYHSCQRAVGTVDRTVARSGFGELIVGRTAAASLLLGIWSIRLCLDTVDSPEFDTLLMTNTSSGNKVFSLSNESAGVVALKTATVRLIRGILLAGRGTPGAGTNNNRPRGEAEINQLAREILAIFQELWMEMSRAPGLALLALHQLLEVAKGLKSSLRPVVLTLLSSARAIPAAMHPRLLLITAWLGRPVQTQNIRTKMSRSAAASSCGPGCTDFIEMARGSRKGGQKAPSTPTTPTTPTKQQTKRGTKQEKPLRVRLDARVSDLMVNLQSALEPDRLQPIEVDDSSYFSRRARIVPALIEWLEVRARQLLTVPVVVVVPAANNAPAAAGSMDRDLDNSLRKKGVEILDVISQWLESRASDLLLSTTASNNLSTGTGSVTGTNPRSVIPPATPGGLSAEESLVRTGSDVVVGLVDWFDRTLSGIFTSSTTSSSSSSATAAAIGAGTGTGARSTIGDDGNPTASTNTAYRLPPSAKEHNNNNATTNSVIFSSRGVGILSAVVESLFLGSDDAWEISRLAAGSSGETESQNNDFDYLFKELESLAQKIVCMHLQASLDAHGKDSHSPTTGSISTDIAPPLTGASTTAASAGQVPISVPVLVPRLGKVVVANAPVRIDIAGGWSDTPPICYETAGAVLNVAIRVDGRSPISCAARFIDRPVAVLRSLRLVKKKGVVGGVGGGVGGDSSSDNQYYDGDQVVCSSKRDFTDVVEPSAPAALLKAVLVVLGVVQLGSDTATEQVNQPSQSPRQQGATSSVGGTADATSTKSPISSPRMITSPTRSPRTPLTPTTAAQTEFARRLAALCGGECRGIEVACCSDLPAGSGMGGSSVVAAAALRAVAHLLGMEVSREQLVHMVSQVEQVLTTGGGWQDQIGAIYGGFKIGRSNGHLPVDISVETFSCSPGLHRAFEKRVVLLYTGQQRLAKNTLINALRRCALTPLESTVPHLFGATTASARRTDATEPEEEGWKNFFGGLSFGTSSGSGSGTTTTGTPFAAAKGGGSSSKSSSKYPGGGNHPVRTEHDLSISTVTALVEAAEAGASLLSEFSGSKGGTSTVGNADDVVDSLGAIINSYWSLKKEMAAGSEPAHIRALLTHLRPLTVGLSLCGAGAGGFAVVILKRDRSLRELREAVSAYQLSSGGISGAASSEKLSLSLHSVQLDQEGISVREYGTSTSTDAAADFTQEEGKKSSLSPSFTVEISSFLFRE